MKQIYSVADAQRRAARVLPPILFDFVEGGGGAETTLRDNEKAFARIKLSPRVATGVVDPNLRTTVLGTELATPIILAPCGGLALIHPHGQLGAARAASQHGSLAVVSTLCGGDIAKVVKEGGGGQHWFQLYKLGGRSGAEALLRCAQQAGYGALVVSVDTPVGARRERDLRHAGPRPGGYTLDKVDRKAILEFAPKVISRPRWTWRFLRAGFPVGHPVLDLLPSSSGVPVSFADAVRDWRAQPITWEDFAWIREHWDGPIVVKGVLGAKDARRAVDHGADSIVVSNHGGRQLDGTPASIDVLPEIVDAVPQQIDVLLDGGVRFGTDIVRAIALGAKAVLIGRPYIYGLSVAGQAGVEQVLEALTYQLREAMQLLGCSDVRHLDATFLTSTQT